MNRALSYKDLIAIAPYDGILKKHETQAPCLGWLLHRNQDKKRAIPIDLGDCSFITYWKGQYDQEIIFGLFTKIGAMHLFHAELHTL